MKYLVKTLCIFITIPILFACGSGNSGFEATSSTTSTSSSTTTTDIVSQKGLVLLFSDASPSLWDSNGIPGTQTTIDVSVSLSDRNNINISGTHTVNFRTEWGSFNTNSCVTSNGTCSVKWTSGNPAEAPNDYRIYFIAYTLGEEEFSDTNGNGFFDDGDSFTTTVDDLPEPFIDCNHNGTYESTAVGAVPADQIIDVQTINGTHDFADGLWNGDGCQHSTLCSGTTLIQIWNSGFIDGNGDTANPTISSYTCSN